MKTTYTTSGSVRGDCGHAHRSIGAAEKCLARDQAGCASQGGYSDRSIVASDGARLVEDEDGVHEYDPRYDDADAPEV